jgi:hypothetical protein
MKWFLTLLTFLLLSFVFGQNKLFDKVHSFDLPGTPQAWNIDNMGNLTFLYKGIMTKVDSTGQTLFTQSIKKVGNRPQILSINSMKTILFSEDQQTLCVLDNTLTVNGKCKELDAFGVVYASLVATSARPNLIWVFDQSNSTLSLINIISDKVEQQVKNFNGLMDSKISIVGMLENDNKLYVWNSNKVVYEFDMLLNLVAEHQVNAIPLSFIGEFLAAVEGERIELLRPADDEKRAIASPEKEVRNFYATGKYFYFETGNKIEKYRFRGFQY